LAACPDARYDHTAKLASRQVIHRAGYRLSVRIPNRNKSFRGLRDRKHTLDNCDHYDDEISNN
jgi:hypothetical protein